MYIWDNYDASAINEKVKFFFDYWQDTCDKIDDTKIDFAIMSPHILVKEILDELAINRLRNRGNREYYRNLVMKYLDSDSAIHGSLKQAFQILKQELVNPRNEFTSELLVQIIRQFEKGTYFSTSFSILKNLLLNEVEKETCKESIKHYTKTIVIDFILTGYSLKSTKDIIESVFSTYSERPDGVVTTKFPHAVKWNDYSEDPSNFYEAVKSAIDSLTIEDRIQQISNTFFKEPTQYYYIFYVRGIRGEYELSHNNVTLYNPEKKTFIQGPKELRKSEFFHMDKDYYGKNAIVHESCIDINYGRSIAKEELNQVLDIFRSFFKLKTSFEIDEHNFVVLDENFHLIQESVGGFVTQKSDWWSYLNLEDYSDFLNSSFPRKVFSVFAEQSLESSNNQYRNSLHWYRKADESNRNEDKILNYWIALESLFNFKAVSNQDVFLNGKPSDKFSLLQEITSHVIIKSFLYNFGWELFHYLRDLVNSKHGTRPMLDLPENLIQKAGLTMGSKRTIYLTSFIESLDEISSHVKREIIHEKVDYVKSLYFEHEFAKHRVFLLKDEVKDELRMIYRIRNKIVHDAFFSGRFAEYSSKKLQAILNAIYSSIVSNHEDDGFSVEKSLMKEYVYVSVVMTQLKEDNCFRLYDHIRQM